MRLRVFSIRCDGPGCHAEIESTISASDANRLARADDWHVGRGGDPDLCEVCYSNAKEDAESDGDTV